MVKALLLLLGLAAGMGAIGLWYFVNNGVSAKEQPGRVEEFLARRARNMAIARQAKSLVAALAIPGYAIAHEGHARKVMGTVTMLHENHLEVKAADGKTSTITLNEKTRILRGKTQVKVEEVKPGERVVVTTTDTKGTDGKPTLVATEIRLGSANTTVSK